MSPRELLRGVAAARRRRGELDQGLSELLLAVECQATLKGAYSKFSLTPVSSHLN